MGGMVAARVRIAADPPDRVDPPSRYRFHDSRALAGTPHRTDLMLELNAISRIPRQRHTFFRKICSNCASLSPGTGNMRSASPRRGSAKVGCELSTILNAMPHRGRPRLFTPG